ncbi:MAG: hypothetical protein WA632_06995 [Gallionella sp.]
MLDKVTKRRDSGECEKYLNDLLKPHDSGGRQGRREFPGQVWFEILKLLEISREVRFISTSQFGRKDELRKARRGGGLFNYLNRAKEAVIPLG